MVMKKGFIVLFMVAFALIGFSTNATFTSAETIYLADSDHDDDEYKTNYENEKEGNEAFEEIGEVTGWGSIVFAVGAGLLFPMRKWLFKILSNTLGKVQSAKIFKFIRKIHIPIGLISIGIGAAHGVLMYISEDELEIRDWIGMGGIGFMLIAMIFGFFMMKKKQKTVWTLHVSTLSLAGALIAIHVLLS